MNILFLTSTFPRFENDSQALFVLEQATAWKRVREEDRIFILAPGDLIPFFLFAQLIAAWKICRTHRIDLIYAHWVMPQGLTAYLINKILKTPFVLQNHSSDLKIFGKIPLIGRPLARAMIKRCQRLFCVNPVLKSEALSYCRPSDTREIEDKITVLPMGFVRMPIVTDQPLRYDIGMIARLSQKKGIDLFIRALAAIRPDHLNLRAVIAGDGEERTSLEALAGTLGMDIAFPGFLTHHAKAQFFSQTRVLVFPSVQVRHDREGLPVAILEALSLGKPIIASQATHITSLPEWPDLKDWVIILQNPRDPNEFCRALEQSLRQPDTNTSVSKLIQNRYEWDHLIHQYLKAISLE